MVLFNYSTKELTAKIVYYGPGLCGKTTNLQYIHSTLPDTVRGKMLSLATKTDRTLFFDFLPIDLGDIRGMKTRVQLYTVPGQVFYNETRKLVLKGADGIVFVADSQQQMLGANVESFRNLEENLKAHGLTLAEMPHVIQFNKRDLPKLASLEEMNSTVNRFNAPFYESVATTGIGVQDTLKAITKLVLLHLTKKYDPRSARSGAGAARNARPAPPAPATPSTPSAGGEAPASIPLAPAAHPSPAGGGGIPLSLDPGMASAASAAGVNTATAEAPTMGEPSPSFGDDEISEMMDEVAEAPAVEAHAAPASDSVSIDPAEFAQETPQTEPSGSEGVPTHFEIDHNVDPEWSTDQGAATQPGEGAQPVALHDAVDDRALFEDPSLEVARMAGQEQREIVVPVEIADAQAGKRRYKLSIRLRLDPVD